MKHITLAAMAVIAMTGSTSAHSNAEDTTPANEATVDAVDVIEMRFDDPMRVTAITLTGPDGDLAIERETGTDAVMEFRALPPSDMPSGAYTVDWRGLSADGHPMQGAFGFTVAD